MDLRKQIYATCFDPVKVKVYNQVTQREELREVPCGKCYHCNITRVNEWTTRMVLESMYNKYCYFVTLTYGIRSEHTEVFAETYPRWSSCNQTGVYQNTPLVLRKSHLQKFFKRLRKNTGVKFKYFAVGEYGHKFGRPHFHMILWSNEPISKMDIYRAWSTKDIYGYRRVIGKIDYNDLMKNGTLESRHSFKYVCKYLQKKDFDFNKLPTKQFHNNLKLYLYDKKRFIDGVSQKDSQYVDEQYRKAFGPFMLCSKSPGIGTEYLYDHIERFSEKDFRLFGISDKSLIFPTYFVRKTKEYLCPYKNISDVSHKPTSFCGIQGLETVLCSIQNCIDFNEAFLSSCPLVRIDYGFGYVEFSDEYFGQNARMPWRFFNFYDVAQRQYYLFAGNRYFRFRKIRGGIELLGSSTVSVVLDRLKYSYDKLLTTLLRPFENDRVRRERCFEQSLSGEFGSKDKYLEVRNEYKKNLLSYIEHRQSRYLVTKNKF